MHRPETRRYVVAWAIFMVTNLIASFFIGALPGKYGDECAAAPRLGSQAVVSFGAFVSVVNNVLLPHVHDESKAATHLNKEVHDDQ